jgi:hypothetical protein
MWCLGWRPWHVNTGGFASGGGWSQLRTVLWLDGCPGVEPRIGLALAEGLCDFGGDHFGWSPPWSGVGSPCPFSFIPWHLPYNWGKARKTSVRVAEQCWVLLVASAWPPCRGDLDRPAVRPSSSIDCEGHQIALGRRRCLPTCQTKGFPASLNFKSKLSIVRKNKSVVFMPVRSPCSRLTASQWGQLGWVKWPLCLVQLCGWTTSWLHGTRPGSM